MAAGRALTTLYLDADACPVKDEAYRVAARHGVRTIVVSNGWLRVPDSPLIERVIVDGGLDVADRWIAERCGAGDVVVTADVPLAAACVTTGARVLAPNGRAFTPSSIGMALATRNLMASLREGTGAALGDARPGGGRPFTAKDRSAFLQALDTALVQIRRVGR